MQIRLGIGTHTGIYKDWIGIGILVSNPFPMFVYHWVKDWEIIFEKSKFPKKKERIKNKSNSVHRPYQFPSRHCLMEGSLTMAFGCSVESHDTKRIRMQWRRATLTLADRAIGKGWRQ